MAIMKDRGMRMLTAWALLVLAPATVLAADIFKGQDVYQLHCASCHGGDGKGMVAGTQDLTQSGQLMQSDIELARKLRDGVPGMPAYRGMLTDAEMRDVIAFLRTLR